MSRSIYLDYAAATPVDEQVIKAMEPYFADNFYNPSSSYSAARLVKDEVEAARGRVAHWLGAKPAEVIFTAGATESINLAFHGVLSSIKDANVVTLATEHDAVLSAAKKYKNKIVEVDQFGIADVKKIKQAVDDSTVLISVSMANNELGCLQPLREIATMVDEIRKLRHLQNKSQPLYLHTDASQAANLLDLHVSSLGVDLMTLNGAKIYGPKQTGVLFVRAGVELNPLIAGGGQESGLRSGTENVPGIIGFATALDIAQTNRREESDRLSLLSKELTNRLAGIYPDLKINSSAKKRLPNFVNVSFGGVDGERLVMTLDQMGVMVSTGSACSANKGTASHVLKAIGLSDSEISGSLRITIGRMTSSDDIEEIVYRVQQAVSEVSQYA